jgi:hypothetical protein
MKNLVVSICGEESLHNNWVHGEKPNFDLFVNYYGSTPGRHRNDSRQYSTFKGTKFVILDQMVENNPELFASYDAIFVPDDDIFMTAKEINAFFELFHEREFWIAQPSVAGWYSIQIICPVPGSLFRYTNWVEIMTPCFSKSAFEICRQTFTENNTNWGIESLWDKLLGHPKDKIAIVDDIVVVHTRPCFFGDTYRNNGNNFEKALGEAAALLEKHDLTDARYVYETVPLCKDKLDNMGSEDRFFPRIEQFKNYCSTLRTRRPKGL